MDRPSAYVSVCAPASDVRLDPAAIDRADALADEARTNSSNVMRTVPAPRSTTGAPAMPGGAASAVTLIGPAASPANRLCHWSSTADGDTSRVAAGGSVARYDSTTDAFWAGVRVTTTTTAAAPSWPPLGGSSSRCDTAAPARLVVPVVPSAPRMYMPEASAARSGTSLSNRIVSVASAPLRSSAGIPTSPGAAESFVVDTARFDAPPSAFPARSLNAGPAASMSIRTGPSALAFAAWAADLWAGVRTTTMRSESAMPASDASARAVRRPSAESSIVMADAFADDASMYSPKLSVSVPCSRFRTAGFGPWPPDRAGGEPSARSWTAAAAVALRAAPLPDRSEAAPGSTMSATAAAWPPSPSSRPDAALTAPCTAALWPAVSCTDASAVYRDEWRGAAPARPVREGADPLADARDTDSTMRDGSTVDGSMCSSNTACSTPSPMCRYEPDAARDGAVSSGTTASRAPSMPSNALADRSSTAPCPMLICDTDACAASAFCSPVSRTRTDADARAEPSALSMDGPCADACAEPPLAPSPPSCTSAGAAPVPTRDILDRSMPVALTYSANSSRTVPLSRSSTGSAARTGGESSASAAMGPTSDALNALPDTSRTAPAAMVRLTDGGAAEPDRPDAAASWAAVSPSRSTVASPPGWTGRTDAAPSMTGVGPALSAPAPTGTECSTNADGSAV